MNALLRLTNYFADFTVFISNWLRTLSIYDKKRFQSNLMEQINQFLKS